MKNYSKSSFVQVGQSVKNTKERKKMNKFKSFIALNVVLISSIACYNSPCQGKCESDVLQFEKRIRRENIRDSMIGKHYYDTKSRQDLVAKADNKRHVIKEVPTSEKNDYKNAFDEVNNNENVHHKIALDLQKRAVKHQPKLEKKKTNSKLRKQSTNEMKRLLLAKLYALLKPVKMISPELAPKHEYITLIRKKRYSNQNDYGMCQCAQRTKKQINYDTLIRCINENTLDDDVEENIMPIRSTVEDDYDKSPDQQIRYMFGNPNKDERNMVQDDYVPHRSALDYNKDFSKRRTYVEEHSPPRLPDFPIELSGTEGGGPWREF